MKSCGQKWGEEAENIYNTFWQQFPSWTTSHSKPFNYLIFNFLDRKTALKKVQKN